jgi:lysozyme
MLAKFAILAAALVHSALSSPIEVRACTGPTINAATVALIKEFEGFVEAPAPDPVGLPTVGYGHLCQTEGCSEVPYEFPLSEAEATTLLMTDVKVCTQSYLTVVFSFLTLSRTSASNRPSRSTRPPGLC